MKLNTKAHITKDGIVKRNPRKRTDKLFYEKIIFDALESEDGQEGKSQKELLEYAHMRFHSEFNHEIQRYGEQVAMTNWLQGLAINIPYMNYEIIQNAKKEGSLPYDATESMEDKLLDNYWRFMANILLQMFRKYGVN